MVFWVNDLYAYQTAGVVEHGRSPDLWQLTHFDGKTSGNVQPHESSTDCFKWQGYCSFWVFIYKMNMMSGIPPLPEVLSEIDGGSLTPAIDAQHLVNLTFRYEAAVKSPGKKFYCLNQVPLGRSVLLPGPQAPPHPPATARLPYCLSPATLKSFYLMWDFCTVHMLTGTPFGVYLWIFMHYCVQSFLLTQSPL